jgi:hypothetical protein
MLHHALSPACRPFTPDAAESFFRIPRESDCLLELLDGFHPRNDNAVRPDIESPLDEAAAQLRDTN